MCLLYLMNKYISSYLMRPTAGLLKWNLTVEVFIQELDKNKLDRNSSHQFWSSYLKIIIS